jgi:DNA-binding transcriptional LysR family regulator
VIQNLEKNEVDFVLMTRLPEHLNIEAIELIPNELVMVGNPEAAKEYFDHSDNYLKTTPFILRENGSATRQAMETYLKNHGIQTNKQLTLTSNEAVKQAVISGMGCSILPIIGIKNELALRQLEIISAPNLPLKSSWFLVHLKEKKHLPAADAFKNYIKNNIDEILIRYFN